MAFGPDGLIAKGVVQRHKVCDGGSIPTVIGQTHAFKKKISKKKFLLLIFTLISFQFQKYMIDDGTAKTLFKKIDMTSHNVAYYKPYNEVNLPEKTGTTHISLIDPDGNGLGATTSINA